MTKKKQPTREELLAQIEALDNSTELAKLQAEVERLTTENHTLVETRRTLERKLSRYEKDVATIREAVRSIDAVMRPVDRSANAMSARVARFGQATVAVGIQKGTHDPATGLPYTDETKPVRDLSASGAAPVRQRELEAIFPELSEGAEEAPESELAEQPTD